LLRLRSLGCRGRRAWRSPWQLGWMTPSSGRELNWATSGPQAGVDSGQPRSLTDSRRGKSEARCLLHAGHEGAGFAFTRRRPQIRTGDHSSRLGARDSNCCPLPIAYSNCNHGPLAVGSSPTGEESMRLLEGTLYTLRLMLSYRTVVPFACPNNTRVESEGSSAGFGVPIQVTSTGIT
jgi:hypothetical protein